MADLMRALGDDAFAPTTLIDKVVRHMPYEPRFLQSLNLTTSEPIYTPSFVMGREKEGLTILPTVPPGAPLPDWKRGTKDVRTFETTRVGEGSTIYAHEIANLLIGPSSTLRVRLQAEIQRRLRGIRRDINATVEHMLLGMVQGLVVDKDGTPIINWFDEWGIVPAVPVPLNLASTTVAQLTSLLRDVRESMELGAQGLVWDGAPMVLMGRTFAKQFHANPEIANLYMGTPMALELLAANRSDPFRRMSLLGFDWVTYRGMDDGSGLRIADDEAKVFPYSARSEIFRKVLAPVPGLKPEQQGQLGKELYAFRDFDLSDRREWVRFELESRPMFVNMRPEMLRTFKAGAS